MNATISRPWVTPDRLQEDEMELLEAYRRAKGMGYADLAVTVQDGVRVKLWLTHKMR